MDIVRFKKQISWILVVILLISIVPVSVFATENTDSNSTTPAIVNENSEPLAKNNNDVYGSITTSGNHKANVSGVLASTYKIIVPKTIVLNGATGVGQYTVKVEGDLSGTEYIAVVPEETFELSNAKKDDITATVTQDKIEWKHKNLNENGTGTVSVESITAGSWNGSFVFTIFKAERVVMLAEYDTWYQGETPRSQITEINVVKDYTVTGNEVESWEAAADFDDDGLLNDDIMCYINGTKLTIDSKGNNQIFLNTYSKNAFKDFTNVTSFTGMDMLNANYVISMTSMFENMSKVEELNVAHFNTSNVMSLGSTFKNCESLKNIDIASWNISKVKYLSYLFSNCNSLKELDLSRWQTKNVKIAVYIFENCSSLTTLNISNWDTSTFVKITGMFKHCNKLQKIDVSKWNTSNVKNMSYTFFGCLSLTSLDLSNWDVSNVQTMNELFFDCFSLNTLKLDNWNTKSLTSFDRIFEQCLSLTTIDVSGFDTSKVTSFQSVFSNAESLTTIIGLENWDTSNVENMNSMFLRNKNLTSLNLTSFDTSNVTDMREMFYACLKLTELDLSSFDTSNLMASRHMLGYCENLTTIYVSNKWTMKNIKSKNLIDENGNPYSGGEFLLSTKLVGGMGTKHNVHYVDYDFAHIDGGYEHPGYFTAKNESIFNQLFIIQQPKNQSTYKDAVFTVFASGQNLMYQWYTRINSSQKWSPYTDTGSDTYKIIIDKQLLHVGTQYYCTIKDKYGNVINSNVVEIVQATPLKIIEQPVSVSVANGTTATIPIKVQGDGLIYTWYYTNNKTSSKFSESSIITNEYSIQMNANRDGRKVYCVITDMYGNSVTTNTVDITMIDN